MRNRFIISENEKNEILKMHKEKFHELTNLEEDEVDNVSDETVDDGNTDVDDAIDFLKGARLEPIKLTSIQQ
jgi:hypothetical protein